MREIGSRTENSLEFPIENTHYLSYMYKGFKIGASLLMGGESRRFGGEIPKQFCLLGGRPLYTYALETFFRTGVFEEIVIVCHPEWMKQLQVPPEIDPGKIRIVPGGSTRQESSWRGLQAFRQTPEWVSIHDVARPFVSESMILENLDAAMKWEGADTCVPSTDTLVFSPHGDRIASVPKRHEFLRGQTPQTFHYPSIVEAHTLARSRGIDHASDDCRLFIESGRTVAISKGSERNMKITSAFDLKIAEMIVKEMGEQ